MKKTIEVCIISLDTPLLSRCLTSVNKQENIQIDNIRIIKNISPMSSAFNDMIQNSKYDYVVQVDEDFILYPNAISSLYNLINEVDNKVICVCAHLLDIHMNRKIHGIKVFKVKEMQQFKYQDTMLCDMNIIEQYTNKGYKLEISNLVLGDHAPIYNNISSYLRYKRMYEQEKNQFKVLYRYLWDIIAELKNIGWSYDKIWGMLGAIIGMTTPRDKILSERDITFYKNNSEYNLLEYYLSNQLFINTTQLYIDVSCYTNVSISVLLPVHNNVNINWLIESINSILNQSFKDFELIIILNGIISNEIRALLNTYNTNKIKIINTEQADIRHALNAGINNANGKYIARQDADDISHPDRFLVQFNFLELYRDIGICGSNPIILNEQGKEIGRNKRDLFHEDILKQLENDNALTHGSVMGRAELFKKHMYSIETYSQHVEDYELWLRMRDDNVKFRNLDLFLYSWRCNTKGICNSNSDLQKQNRDIVKSKYNKKEN